MVSRALQLVGCRSQEAKGERMLGTNKTESSQHMVTSEIRSHVLQK